MPVSARAEQFRNNQKLWARPGSAFDYLVKSLRVILPSFVGILAAIMLASPFGDNRELSFVLARNQVAKTQDRMSVENALYRGEDSLGRPFSLRAGNAVQKSARDPVLEMSNIEGRMILNDAPAYLVAGQSSYNLENETVQVNGPMSFKSDKGYTMLAHDVTMGMKDQMLSSNGEMNFTTPEGYQIDSSNSIVNLRDRIVRSQGNMRLKTRDGFTLEAANVELLLNNKTMRSFGPVFGRTNVGDFRADRIEADWNSRIVILRGNAQLRINQNVIR
jgi:lipopolysaccharide export system protein LptC